VDGSEELSRRAIGLHGWHFVGSRREMGGPLHPAAVGGLPLMLVAGADGVHVFSSVCPHRGADLARGGTLVADRVRCAFHGREVALGGDDPCSSVPEYPSIDVGGCVFCLVGSDDPDRDSGFRAFATRLAREHWVVPGFVLDIDVSAPFVIENAFDADHFQSVHGVERRPELEVATAPDGHLVVTTTFFARMLNPWQQRARRPNGELVDTHFRAHVFSPWLVASEIGDDDDPSIVITGSSPRPDGGCTVRVAVALPRREGASPPPQATVTALLADSRKAFEQDTPVWTHLHEWAADRYGPGDEAVRRFRSFCRRFMA